MTGSFGKAQALPKRQRMPTLKVERACYGAEFGMSHGAAAPDTSSQTFEHGSRVARRSETSSCSSQTTASALLTSRTSSRPSTYPSWDQLETTLAAQDWFANGQMIGLLLAYRRART